MKKVRVFELAKTFGMKGPELAKLLRDLGFENIKTHMTVLDEAEEMMVLGRLDAHGLKRRQPSDAAADKPQKRRLPAAAETELEPEPLPRKRSRTATAKKQLPTAQPRRPARRDESAPADASTAAAPPPAEPRVPAGRPAAEAPAPGPASAPVAPAQPAPAPPAAPAGVEPPERPATERPAAGRPAAERPAAGRPAAEPPAQERPAAERPAAERPAAERPAAERPAREQPAPERPAAARPAAERPAPERPAAERPAAEAPAAGAADTAEPVRKLLVPQKKAQVLGRIELPAETIRDATRRSAPAAERDLRRAALQKTRERSATRSPMHGQRRGPSGPGRGRDSGPRGGKKSRPQPTVDPGKEVEITPPVSVKSFSEALGIKVSDLLSLTFKIGIAGKTINSYLSTDEVELMAVELDRKVKIVEQKQAEQELEAQLVDAAESETQSLRAPVVTFMGHVDHGKTSLLDALRHSDVVKAEAGGITQHIGAYKITNERGQSVVVLDTPGHAAFTAMRARGANLTDLVVLVVAADDGVKPQTEEAINHAKAANAKIVVAINKCDLPAANPMQVKQQLMIKGLQSEDFGGEIGMVEVSAVTRQGLDDLIDRILLESEMLDLKARPDAAGRGVVVESKQSPEQGVVVTVLVTDGTLRVKDQVVCGESLSRVRAMIDDHGRQLNEAGPSTPVTMFGLDRLPVPGDKLWVVEDARKAREVVEDRQRRIRELSLAERSAVTLETLSARLTQKDIEEIKVILKADAMGSLEPLRKCLADLSTPEVRVNLVHSALGGINETDVSLAEASGAVIVGFNTIADSSARQAAERAGVEIRYYDVIYELLDEMKAAMEGLLKPEEVENVIGHAEVRATFKSSKIGTIAGCYVTDGIVKRNAKVRLSRDGTVVHTSKVATLRREKDDVREVRAGFECGMTLDYQDVKVGDVLEFAQVELIKRTLQ